MPQLDLGIFISEIFTNVIFFFILYFFKAKKVFPLLNKGIKLRKYKLKKLELKLFSFENNLLFLLKNNNKYKEEEKKKFIYLLNNLIKKNNLINNIILFKNYNLFLLSIKIINTNYLNKNIYLKNII